MSTVNQHTTATKLFFDCGHAELKPLNATEYRHVSVGGPCTACRNATERARLILLQVRDLLQDIQDDERLRDTVFEPRIESALREIESVV